MKKVIQLLVDKKRCFGIKQNILHLYDYLSDEEMLKKTYQVTFEKKLNLDNPQTFSEKLQWLKLYDRKEIYTIMVDKHLVKQYVADKIGEQYIIPTLGVWDSPEEVDFSSLPEQFVLKCNHNSGLGMYIHKEKSILDEKKVKKGLHKGLKEDYYLSGREWPYKNVSRKIIAEKYMSCDGQNELADYKVHCFQGEPKFILVCKDRFSESGLTEDFFTTSWEHMELKRPGCNWSAEAIPKPDELEEILALAAKLSKGIPFLRVDFYIVNHKVYFSELTFFPASGFTPFEPDVWDKTFGDWLVLPDK